MGRVKPDLGRAGSGSWACWVHYLNNPNPPGWAGLLGPAGPRARRAGLTHRACYFLASPYQLTIQARQRIEQIKTIITLFLAPIRDNVAG
jgi:hypothetical protein